MAKKTSELEDSLASTLADSINKQFKGQNYKSAFFLAGDEDAPTNVNEWVSTGCSMLDLAISNPPYIPRDTYEKLPKEVKNFEPKVALLGGEDGLKHIREIIQKAPLFLKEKGWLILENHFDQGEKVKQLLIKNKFTSIEIVKDLSGIGRFTIGRYK